MNTRSTKQLFLSIGCVSIVLWTGCSSKDSPGATAKGFFEALAKHDWTNTIPLATSLTADCLEAMRPEFEKQFNEASSGADVKIEVAKETIQGDRAMVRLKMGKAGKESSEVWNLRKENGKWKVDMAEKLFPQVIQLAPVTGAADQAINHFKTAKLLNMGGGSAWGKLGLMLFDGKQYDESLEAFQRSAESDDVMWSFASLVWQGHVLDLQGKREEAVKCYREALSKPKKPAMRHEQYGINLSEAWVQERIKQPFKRDEAREVFMATFSKAPWTGAGKQALDLFEKAKPLELDATDWGRLGMMLYDGKYYPQSLEAFQKATTNGVKTSWEFVGLVWQGHVLDLQGKRSAALKCYREAMAKPQKPTMRHDQYGIVVNQKWVEDRLKQPFQRK